MRPGRHTTASLCEVFTVWPNAVYRDRSGKTRRLLKDGRVARKMETKEWDRGLCFWGSTGSRGSQVESSHGRGRWKQFGGVGGLV